MDIITKRGFDVSSFSERLKQLRKKRQLSQAALGKIVGVTQSTVGMWESGQREPDFNTLLRLAQVFEVTTDYLLGSDRNPVIIATRGMPLPPPGAENLTPEELEEIAERTRAFHEFEVRRRLREKGVEL